jgi:ribosomal protein S18 acetylase RimI-like enzyme
MDNYILDHLFEFWEYIGLRGDFLSKENGFKYTSPSNMSWPCKVFGIDSKRIDLEQLKLKMNNGILPKSLGILEDELTEKLLLSHNYEKTSVVKGMSLNLSNEHKAKVAFPTIQRVDTKSKAIEFANVAAKSFGYEIYPKTIISLLNFDSKIRLYLGSHNGSSVSCGIIFLDENKVSGIHMIGTIPEYRGRGLGKIMTTKLICEAFNNRSNTVVLVASESGERIYSKMGFKVDGTLSSYSIQE